MSIKFCAELCEQSYEDHITLAGFHTTFISDGSAQAYILSSREKIYVVFRGTSEVEDVFTDLKFWRRNGVHAGFLGQFRALEDEINEALSSFTGGQSIVFTGHSLGGSLALIAAEASPYRSRIRRVITFGAPKPGGRAFRKRYRPLKCVTWNVVTPGDIIPRLQVLSVHAGQQLLIGRDTLVENPSPLRLWWLFIRNRSVAEHGISTYIKYIRLNWSNLCKNY